MNAQDFIAQYPDEVPTVCQMAGTNVIYFKQLAAGVRYPSRDLALALERASGGRMTRLELLYPDEANEPNEETAA